MEMRFLGQPFDDDVSLGDFIESGTSGHFNELQIAVAWAKKSGLARVLSKLEGFRADGGHVTLIVGISEGGATREGLDLALEVSDLSYVFHDPRRTFHPKVYFAKSPGRRSLLVGSSNLTAGGLGWNFEASVWLDWLAGEWDEGEHNVESWFARLIAEEQSCRPLSAELIADIEASDDIVLGRESSARRVQRASSPAPEDSDSVLGATISGLFEPVRNGLMKLPALGAPRPITYRGTPPVTRPGSVATVPTNTAGPAVPAEDIQHRWFRELDNTAAQQVKSLGSNPTGNLRLSQGDSDFDHKVYFRNVFFGGLPWAPTEGKDSEQEVVVDFQVRIVGTALGIQGLRISHDPKRIAGQANVPTVLHWGTLGQVLRSTSYVGMYVTLERSVDGKFYLTIEHGPTGPHLP